MRDAYVGELHARLPVGCRGLLVTLEYPPDEKAGPPFPVDAAEVERLYGRDWEVEQLERRDILASEPGFTAEGVTALCTAAWQLVTVVTPGSLSERLKTLLQWWSDGDRSAGEHNGGRTDWSAGSNATHCWSPK